MIFFPMGLRANMNRQTLSYTTTLLIGSLLFVLPLVAGANPLYEHRALLKRGGDEATLEASQIAAVAAPGRLVLSMTSGSALDRGLRSGDPVVFSIGKQTIRTHVAFRDELDREVRFLVETGKPATTAVTPRLVVDRVDRVAPVTIETSFGSAVMHIEAKPGEAVVFQTGFPGRGVRRGVE